MNPTNLDLDTVRSLIAAKDLGGFRHAADHLGRTPSAISLQMKRLEDSIGAKLFRRRGRGTELTEAGEIVLSYGRKMLALNDELLDTIRGTSLAGTVTVGFSQDFAETISPNVLSQFTKLYPFIQIEVRIESTETLVDSVEAGQLDLALVMGQENRSTAQVLGDLELGWIASRNFSPPSGHSLPLVLLGPQCLFRKRAIAVLDHAEVPWRIAAVSPSVAGAWASTRGGVGVMARSTLGVPQELIYDHALFGLPHLGSCPITLHMRKIGESHSIERLQAIITDAVTQVLADASKGKAQWKRRSPRWGLPT